MNKSNQEERLIRLINESFSCDVMCENRKQNNVFGRHALSAYLVKNLNYTLEKAGKVVNRNHANVINSIKKHFELYGYNKEYKTKYNNFIDKVVSGHGELFCQPVKFNIKNLL